MPVAALATTYVTKSIRMHNMTRYNTRRISTVGCWAKCDNDDNSDNLDRMSQPLQLPGTLVDVMGVEVVADV
jgi:hypothetical protein